MEEFRGRASCAEEVEEEVRQDMDTGETLVNGILFILCILVF